MIHKWQFILAVLAGRINEHQQHVIQYLCAENRVLKEQLRQKLAGRRLLLDDDQRRRLAVHAKQVGRKTLREMEPLFTPDTLLRWFRQLVAQKYDGSGNRAIGRPQTQDEIQSWILRLANENHSWGYTRIRGALCNLGFEVSRSTIRRILTEHGIVPAPERRKHVSWHDFLKRHASMICATDFFTVEIWTFAGLTRVHVLFLIDLATRAVEIAGIARQPHGQWMLQVARNLTDCFDGFLAGKRFLIHDRDPLFTREFHRILRNEGIEAIVLPAKSPNLNAFAERFVRSIKSECLDQMIIFGENNLRRIIAEYLSHYHQERNHQGLDNRLIRAGPLPFNGKIHCHERLGGLLKYYHRDAA